MKGEFVLAPARSMAGGPHHRAAEKSRQEHIICRKLLKLAAFSTTREDSLCSPQSYLT
jgi:hypothetical protein